MARRPPGHACCSPAATPTGLLLRPRPASITALNEITVAAPAQDVWAPAGRRVALAAVVRRMPVGA